MRDHYLFCFVFQISLDTSNMIFRRRQRMFFWLISFRHHSYFSVGRKTFKLLSIKTGLIVKQNKIPARLNWSMYLSIAFVWWGIKMSNYILEMIERVPALIRYSDYCQIKKLKILVRIILSTILNCFYPSYENEQIQSLK